MDSTPLGQPGEIRILVFGERTPDVDRLEAALLKQGCRLSEHAPVTVAVMTAPDAAGVPDETEVIPVSFLGKPGPLWQHLSHVVIPGQASDAEIASAAGRIASIVRIGGARLVEWNRLVSQARAWRVDSAAPLADGSQIATGYGLSALIGESGIGGSEVRAYLDASSSAETKARRRRGTVSVTVALILCLVTAMAIMHTARAVKSAAAARVAEATTESERLSALAESLITRDADAPAILANEALARHVGATSMNAAVKIAASSLPHTAFSLPGSAARLDAEGDCAAAGLLDGRIELVSLVDGSLIAELVGESGATPRVAPDCSAVAVFFKGTATIHDREGNELMQVPDIIWMDWDAVLGLVVISRDGELLQVHEDGGTSPLLADPFDEPFRVAAFSDVGTVAVATSSRALILDIQSGNVLYEREVGGGIDIGLSPDGRFLYVLEGIGVTAINWEMGQSQDASNLQGYVEPLENGLFVVGGRSGSLVLRDWRISEPLLTIPVSSGQVAPSATSGHRLVTASVDGKLQVWDLEPAMVATDNASRCSIFINKAPSPTARNRIISVGGPRGWAVIDRSCAPEIDLDASTFDPNQGAFLGSWSVGIPAHNGKHVVIVSMDGLSVYEVDEQTQTLIAAEPLLDVDGFVHGGYMYGVKDSQQLLGMLGLFYLNRKAMHSEALPFVADVSPSGRYTVLATPDRITIWDAQDSAAAQHWDAEHIAEPLAVKVTDDGTATVLRSTRWMQTVQVDADPVDVELRVADSTAGFTAAALSGDSVVAVTSAGGLAVFGDRGTSEPQVIAPDGSFADAFAIVVDDESDRLAVMTPFRFAILDVSKPEATILANRASVGGLYVSDVAFRDGGGAIAVTSAGALIQIQSGQPVPVAEWVPTLHEARALTDEERLIWGVEPANG
jgi:hypothetical protein